MARFGGIFAAVAGVFLVQRLGQGFVSTRSVPTIRGRTAMRAEGEATAVADRVQLKILSPEGEGFTESATEVILPSASGQLGILANHAPMMSALDVGVLRYKQDGEWKPLVVMGGFATVEANTLSILVNDWESGDDISVDQAKEELEEATKAMEVAESKTEKLEASQAVKRASARLQAAMYTYGASSLPVENASVPEQAFLHEHGDWVKAQLSLLRL
ncbi:atpE [Symbiodinium sp. CCMP2456]|nr:atpE [Symbiodinium sp. CCMP2456]